MHEDHPFLKKGKGRRQRKRKKAQLPRTIGGTRGAELWKVAWGSSRGLFSKRPSLKMGKGRRKRVRTGKVIFKGRKRLIVNRVDEGTYGEEGPSTGLPQGKTKGVERAEGKKALYRSIETLG